MHLGNGARAGVVLFSIAIAANACSESGTVVTTCASPPAAVPYLSFPTQDPTELRPGPAPAAAGFSPAPHTPWPPLPSNGFVAPATVQLEIITTEGDPLRDRTEAFGHAVATSQWWRAVGEDYGLPPTIASVLVTHGGALTGYVDGDAIEAYVHDTSQVPLGGEVATIRVLFLPAGATIAEGGTANCGCSLITGFHSLSRHGEVYAVIQRCGDAETELDALTVTASHEIIEAATDPLGTTNILADTAPLAVAAGGYGEVGDLCGDAVYEGPWALARSWSISAAAAGDSPCVPRSTDDPYFNASAPADWYDVAPGATVDIPLAAWSSAPRPDWYLLVRSAAQNGFTASISTARVDTLGTHTLHMVNNGETATLSVTAPAATAGNGGEGGDGGASLSAVIEVGSLSAVPYVGHIWAVGVRVR